MFLTIKISPNDVIRLLSVGKRVSSNFCLLKFFANLFYFFAEEKKEEFFSLVI